ncbi:hypothetical protein ACRWU2_16500, partial [Escherichia coli]
MIKLSEKGVFLASNNEIIAEEYFTGQIKKEEAKKGTIAWSILSSHNTSGNMDKLKIKFDSLASHDITFVGIVQTAKEGANKRGNSSRLTQSFHFFMFEPIFSPVNA